MDKCYRYYKEDDRILRCFCERDEDPQNPIYNADLVEQIQLGE